MVVFGASGDGEVELWLEGEKTGDGWLVVGTGRATWSLQPSGWRWFKAFCGLVPEL